MPVYQCSKGPTVLTFNYDRVVFAQGQLINSDHSIFRNHPNFKLLKDNEEAKKRAPAMYQVRPPPSDPNMLSHEQIIAELRAYGFLPNPYELTSQLAFKLNLVRRKLKKTYITVLDDKGNPTWLENYKMFNDKEKEKKKQQVLPNEITLATKEEVKQPDSNKGSIGMVERNDDYKEGQDVDLIGFLLKTNNGEFVPEYYETEDDKNVNLEPSMKVDFVTTEEKNEYVLVDLKTKYGKKIDPDESPTIQETNKEENKINLDNHKIEYRGPKEELTDETPMDMENSEESEEVEDEDNSDKSNTSEEDEEDEDDIENNTIIVNNGTKFAENKFFVQKIDNDDIIPENYEYLIDTKPFCLEPLTEEELANIRVVNWKIINLYVNESFLRNKAGILYADISVERRWILIRKTAEFYNEEPEKTAIELNMLQKRFMEISKLEPDYRKSQEKKVRKRLTALINYGLDIEFSTSMTFNELRRYCKKAFACAKLGKQMISDPDELDKFLVLSGRVNVVMDHVLAKKQKLSKQQVIDQYKSL